MLNTRGSNVHRQMQYRQALRLADKSLPWPFRAGAGPASQPLCAVPLCPPLETHPSQTVDWCTSLPNPVDRAEGRALP